LWNLETKKCDFTKISIAKIKKTHKNI